MRNAIARSALPIISKVLWCSDMQSEKSLPITLTESQGIVPVTPDDG